MEEEGQTARERRERREREVNNGGGIIFREKGWVEKKVDA